MKQVLSLGMNVDPDSKVQGANIGPIWGRQDPGGPHAGPMNFAIWEVIDCPRRIPAVARFLWYWCDFGGVFGLASWKELKLTISRFGANMYACLLGVMVNCVNLSVLNLYSPCKLNQR